MKNNTVRSLTVLALSAALASSCATGDFVGSRHPSSDDARGGGGGGGNHSPAPRPTVGNSGQGHTNGNRGATPPVGRVGTNPNHGSPGGHGGGTNNVVRDGGNGGNQRGGTIDNHGSGPVAVNRGGRNGVGPTGHAVPHAGQRVITGPRGQRTIGNFIDSRNPAQIHADARFLDHREFDPVHFDWRWTTFHENSWWTIWGIPSYAQVQYVTCEAVDVDTGLIYPTTETLAPSAWTDDEVNWTLENALDDCEANLNLSDNPNDVCVPVSTTNGCFWNGAGAFPADDNENFNDDITTTNNWAVIVLNPQTGSTGVGRGPDRGSAETQALAACGADCAGVDAATLESGTSALKETWDQNGWVALARDAAGHWGTGGVHDSQPDAEGSALSNCNRATGSAQDCAIVTSLSAN